ncbi:MAG: U32 family peptidase [Solobacterium sp.]|nr:U32 family peptidase [Solobacterium sp.]
MKHKTELLAPAGNMESLKAAAAAGADAVYLGLNQFSARAFAGNFSHEEFLEAIRFCHIRDMRIYVTLNTLYTETEIENVKKEVAFLYENDADGILVQDPGLFYYIRRCYPEMPVHCSTQMHIHNIAGVKWMQKEGASRVVMARETPLEIIREACETGMEIEVFAYGALCISYSGQCLMSSVMKNRSANKGLCAQYCRMRYYPAEGGRFPAGDYILSPRDLNIIDRLPELLDCGVASLKIEGRMKRPEYVYLAVRTFREAIDAYYAGKEYHVSGKRLKELQLLFHRGFTYGHLFHQSIEKRMNPERPNHMGVEAGVVLEGRKNSALVRMTETVMQNDGLRILHEPEDIGLSALRMKKDGKFVQSAKPGEVIRFEFKDENIPAAGDILRKTTDQKLMDRIRSEIDGKKYSIPVSMQYAAYPGSPFMLTVSDGERQITVQSDLECSIPQKAPLSTERLEENLRKTGDTPFSAESLSGDSDPFFLPMREVNAVRRNALEQLASMRAKRYDRSPKSPDFAILHEPDVISDRILIEDQGQDSAYAVLPVVNENLRNLGEYSKCICSEMGDLYGTHDKCIAGMTLNACNSYALAYFISKGMNAVIFSSEISDDAILRAVDAFHMRYGFIPTTYKFVYGRRTLMYIKQGFIPNGNINAIRDYHGQKYPVIYNNGNVSLLEPDASHKANPYCWGSYLIFTDETEQEKGDIQKEAYEEITGRI